MADNYEAKPFTPTRADIGQMVPRKELVKRLAYELQIPQSYGLRVLNAYTRVINDALEHGEGLNLHTVTLRLTEFKTRTVRNGFSNNAKRKRMYKYKTSLTGIGKEVLERLTEENFDDI